MARKNPGFSLIELLIALAILAAMTTVAIRATNGLQSQARYQATTRSLTDIQNAILGPANGRNPDGTPLLTGFVSDMGRLPNWISGADPLGELTNLPVGVSGFNSVPATSDNSVKVFTGWQGPYLRLAPNATVIRDGWGNAFHPYDSSNNLILTSGSSISQIRSWAADNVADPAYGGSAISTVTIWMSESHCRRVVWVHTKANFPEA